MKEIELVALIRDGFGARQQPAASFLPETCRRFRAALLYADSVFELQTAFATMQARFASPTSEIRFAAKTEHSPTTVRVQSGPWGFTSQATPALFALGRRIAGFSDDLVELSVADCAVVDEAAADLLTLRDAGLLRLPTTPLDSLESHERGVEVFGSEGPVDARGLEGLLATTLLGDIEGFPDAPLDVVLDVRSRLMPVRARFRAAIIGAAEELAAEGPTPAQAKAAIVDVRLRVVEPAISEIREELEALRVRRTLLRLASDRVNIGASAATISVFAGAGGRTLGEVLKTATAATLGAAVAKEAEHRAETRAKLRLRPFWLLHEAERLLKQP